MINYEIKKHSIYILLGTIIIVFLTIIQIGMNYSYSITISIMDSEYTFSGSEYINRNKEIIDKFSGKIMDDGFFKEFDTAVLKSIQSDENGKFDAKKSLQMSSLYRLYGMMRTNEYESLGTAATDMDAVFGDNKPIFYYTDNWRIMRSVMSAVQLLLIFVGTVLAAPLFSKEYSDSITQIIHTMHNGRRRFAITKFAAIFILLTLLYVVVIGGTILSVGILWGFDNPGADIRCMTDASFTAMDKPMSCVVMILLQFIIGYAAMLMMTAITIVLSSLINKTTVTLIIGFAAAALPKLIPLESVGSAAVQKAASLMPINFAGFLTSGWGLFDHGVGIIYLTGVIVVVFAIVCCILASIFYINHKIA